MPTVTGLIGLPLPGPASLGQLAQQVAWPPRRELATPPSLLAYNKYAEELRDTLKDTAQLTAEETGVQLEKVIGQRWKEMPKLEKDGLIDKALSEQRRLVAEGGVAQFGAASSRPKKSKASKLGPDGLPLPKRMRGRPRKDPQSAAQIPTNNRVYLAAPGVLGGGPINDAHMLPYNPVPVMGMDGPATTAPPGGEELMGQRVQGVVDGVFDVGYFLTVSVNNCLMRGIIWQEDTCMRVVGQHAMQQQQAAAAAAATQKSKARKTGAAGGGGKGGDGGSAGVHPGLTVRGGVDGDGSGGRADGGWIDGVGGGGGGRESGGDGRTDGGQGGCNGRNEDGGGGGGNGGGDVGVHTGAAGVPGISSGEGPTGGSEGDVLA
uniref:Uncharacterized protein n=1 Tax=Mantoniella antarctica TaxID=81844 RepID=A0A6U3FBY9_9CHLO